MADVENIYRCEVCGEPITAEQELVIVPKNGQDMHCHRECQEQQERE